MTAAGELLRDEIARSGPLAFSRFMQVALYDTEHGYYRRRGRGVDPFGKDGDFFTASQLQPVFGTLIASLVRRMREELGPRNEFHVVELGAGRGEMAPYFSEWPYTGVDAGQDLPASFSGAVFANEFFDALPVDVAVRRGEVFVMRRAGFDGERFVWVDAEPIEGGAAEYLEKYAGPCEEGGVVEVCVDALQQLDSLARAMSAGFLLAIDYGYTTRERIRFPQGTLMAYHRHQALEDVLDAPGERDITAHVNFSALQRHAENTGWETVRFESMASLLLRAGEPDQFASALGEGLPEKERVRRRLQLKTLLYGMGETFRALTMRRK